MINVCDIILLNIYVACSIGCSNCEESNEGM